MKVAVILLFLTFILHSYARSQKIHLSEKNISLERAFRIIEKQSGYHFWYDHSIMSRSKKISVKGSGLTLKEALEICLRDQPLSYRIVNKTIVITPAAINNTEKNEHAEVDIFGIVTDSSGNALAGVSVTTSGNKHGVTTDESGHYRLRTRSGSVLNFSLVSYQPQQFFVQENKRIDVSLVSVDSVLSDVVVVGYGSLSRKNFAGSVSSISMRSWENQPVASFDQAIAGQAAGVRVSQLTGTPGGGLIIRVRGTGSISAGNEPLYVIDGFPIEGSYNRDLNPLATLNPNDIESIQILKDASSVAIYGSRGSNGVIIVNTKRGKKSGKAAIQFDAYYGLQRVLNKIDMLNAEEYARYNIEARNNAWKDMGGNPQDPNELRPDIVKIPPMYADPASLGEGTNWQEEIFQTAAMQNHQLSISSGGDKTQYRLSLAHFNQEGIVIHTGFDRYSFRFNLDSKLYPKFKIGMNIAASVSQNDILPVDDQVFQGGILGSALAMPPTVPVFNEDGTYTTLLNTSPYNIGIIDNPVAMANQLKGGTSAYRTMGGIFAEYEVITGLKIKTSAGGDFYQDRYNFFWPSTLGRNGITPPVIAEAYASSARNFVWLNENTITYNKEIHLKHFINAVAGISSQRGREEQSYLRASNFPNDEVTNINAGQITGHGTDESEWSLFSVLARINYSYSSKYLFTATFRTDGSSRFGIKNRWASFPSVSAGWNVSNEPFLSNVKLINNLKIRGSFGYAGNNSIGNYSSIGTLVTSRYVFGPGAGRFVNGLYPSKMNNDLLGWEKMKQTCIGAEIAILNNRFSLVVDYYNKITSHLLLQVPVPGSTGFASALQNIGRLGNRGWELTLTTQNTTGSFGWKTDFNLSTYRNKVLALGPAGDPIISTSKSFSPATHITMIGQPVASFYGYEVIGVYRDQADVDKSPVVEGSAGSRPGDLKFRDTDGNGVITTADMKIIGSNIPDFTYGITNEFYWKNFSLSIMIDGVQGVQVMNGSRRNIGLVNNSYSRRDVLNRWQSPEKPGDGRTPRANVIPTGGNVSFVSSLLIEDASFLRVRNIHLRYSVPYRVFRGMPVKNASLYLSVQNAYMFTRYKGFNPEQNLNGADALTPGIDFNGYPIARIFTAGINIAF